jgi:hypothetical protein
MRIRSQAAVVTAAIALAASWPAEAKQPNPASDALRMLPDESESFSRTPLGRVSNETGFPLALYRVNHPVRAGAPEGMARQYLREAAAQLGLRQPDLSDLRHRATRVGLGTITVRFDQTFRGLPVYESEVTVSLDRHATVIFVMNGYKARVSLDDVTPWVTPSAARATALAHLRAQGELRYEKTELVVYPGKGGSRLAYRVRLEPGVSPLGYWDVLIDARTGQVFRVEDRACYRHAAERAEAPEVNGAGTVFNIDPLSSSGGTTYGTGGFVDGNDADTPDLTGQLINVTLLDIDLTGGIHTLKGPWAEVVDFEAPFKGLFTQASSTFNYTRNPDNFEAANTYYHIDKIMRYINGTGPTDLGLNVRPFAYPGGVQFDPSGFNGADNSHYLGGSQRLAFGEGGVDDAEDADVVIHELGHGLHDWVTNGSLSQVNGLSEGSGDYIAASYSRAANLVPSANPHFNWVFNWDGHNPFWAGRITNYAALYPGGLTGQIHTDGQIWATCLMRIWNQLGAIKTDKVFLEGLGMTNSSTNQDDAAQALMNAAAALGYTLPEQTIMFNEFTATGYTVVIVPVELMSVTVE